MTGKYGIGFTTLVCNNWPKFVITISFYNKAKLSYFEIRLPHIVIIAPACYKECPTM